MEDKKKLSRRSNRKANEKSRFTVPMSEREVYLLKKMGGQIEMSANQISDAKYWDEMMSLRSKNIIRAKKKEVETDKQFYTLTARGRENYSLGFAK